MLPIFVLKMMGYYMNSTVNSGFNLNNIQNFSHKSTVSGETDKTTKNEIDSKISEMKSLITKINDINVKLQCPLSDRTSLFNEKTNSEALLLSMYRTELVKCKCFSKNQLYEVNMDASHNNLSSATKQLKSLVPTLNKILEMNDSIVESIKNTSYSPDTINPAQEKMLSEINLLKKEVVGITEMVNEDLVMLRNKKRRDATKDFDVSKVHETYLRHDAKDIKTLSSHIKLEKKHDAIVVDSLEVNAIKSEATVKMEKVFNSLMADYNNTNISYKNDEKGDLIHLTVTLSPPSSEVITFLPEDFKKINYSQISVSDEHLARYEHNFLQYNGTLIEKHPGIKNAKSPSELDSFFKAQEGISANQFFSDDAKKREYLEAYSKIHNGYKIALSTYTGHSYRCMNLSARGKSVEEPSKDTPLAPLGAEAFKQGFLHLTIAEQALRKLPNVPTTSQYTFRGERHSEQVHKLMALYENAVKNETPLIVRQGIFSTGEQPAPGEFSDPSSCAAFVIIKGLNKKDISHYSKYPTENERLHAGTNLCIQGFKKYEINGKEVIYVIAKVVDDAVVYKSARKEGDGLEKLQGTELENNIVEADTRKIKAEGGKEGIVVAAALTNKEEVKNSDSEENEIIERVELNIPAKIDQLPPIPAFNPKLKLSNEILKTAEKGAQIHKTPNPNLKTTPKPLSPDTSKPKNNFSDELSNWALNTLTMGGTVFGHNKTQFTKIEKGAAKK